MAAERRGLDVNTLDIHSLAPPLPPKLSAEPGGSVEKRPRGREGGTYGLPCLLITDTGGTHGYYKREREAGASLPPSSAVV